MSNYILYGAPASYYTGKVRAYLSYKHIPYCEQISSMGVYKKIILPKTGVGMIPVVKTPEDEYWQDSSLIIDQFEQRFGDRPVTPSSPKQAMASLLFELIGDEWMRLPAMHYRWNFPEHNLKFIKSQFGASVAPSMPGFIQRWLGKKVVDRFSGYVGPLGINPTTIPAIEQWYKELLSQLDQHFGQQPFLLGSKPCLGDFGLFGPLYAHLYRDPYPGQQMRKLAPNVVAWVERLLDAGSIAGAFLGGDQVPSSLEPILSRMFSDFWPSLISSAERLEQWANENPGKTKPPRLLGMHPLRLGDVVSEQMCLSYSQWMLQRNQDYYQSLAGDQRAEVDAWLGQLGGLEAMQYQAPRRVGLKDYRIQLVAK
ncbi:MAG: glutathione S-transferase [Cellvibrionaceae bacterium]|nr:glutathione S-transferase [Cellvibrionaceae bacterium]